MSLRGKLTLAGLTLGLMLSLSSAPVFAQQQQQTGAPDHDARRGERGEGGPRHRGKRGGDMGFLRILRQLDLTEAQQQQARTIVENHMEATKAQREELMRLREQREQDSPQADVDARAKELRQQLQESAKNMRAQLLTILTPEQRTRFDQMETEFKARRRSMRERPPIPQENDQQ